MGGPDYGPYGMAMEWLPWYRGGFETRPYGFGDRVLADGGLNTVVTNAFARRRVLAVGGT